MAQVCILTDSSAQFLSEPFPGQELVSVIPMQFILRGKVILDSSQLTSKEFPDYARDGDHPRIQAPSPENFYQAFATFQSRHQEVLLILLSRHLNPAIESAMRAAVAASRIYILDSQTTGVGLGFLVQLAAEAAAQGATAIEIKRYLQAKIPLIYSLFCIQSLSYLFQNGYIDPAQAYVGEMLGLMPFMLLENGRLTPMQKARNNRHVVEIFSEFLAEFNDAHHIALIHSKTAFVNETHHLKERILEILPDIPMSQHLLSPAVASLVGPLSLGMVVIDNK